MSLERVELRSLDASRIRLSGASDIEKLSLYDVAWAAKGSGNRLTDEDDLDQGAEGSPTPQEVERLYRALRKNREDRSDRAEAHRWYFAEMEVGRRWSKNIFTKLARAFYRYTSGYGLSAALAFQSFLIVVAVTFLFFSIPRDGVCPIHDSAAKAAATCVGWATRLKVVILAVSLQGVPDGARLAGIAANVVWLIGRFGGAAMLLSIGLAFRNQISR
jgi:hypothetical protein